MDKQKNHIQIAGNTFTLIVPLDQQNAKIMALGMLEESKFVIAAHFMAQERKALQSQKIIDSLIVKPGGPNA